MTALATTTTSLEMLYGNPRTDRAAGVFGALAVASSVLVGSCVGMPIASAAMSTSAPLRIAFVQSSREGWGARQSVADSIIGDLGRLVDGWDGANSIAPSSAIIDDLAIVLAIVDITDANAPEVHVDSDGSTSLVWLLSDERLVSLEFFGKGDVLVTAADEDPAKSFSRKFAVRDDVSIAMALEQAGVI